MTSDSRVALKDRQHPVSTAAAAAATAILVSVGEADDRLATAGEELPQVGNPVIALVTAEGAAAVGRLRAVEKPIDDPLPTGAGRVAPAARATRRGHELLLVAPLVPEIRFADELLCESHLPDKSHDGHGKSCPQLPHWSSPWIKHASALGCPALAFDIPCRTAAVSLVAGTAWGDRRLEQSARLHQPPQSPHPG
jgi:hypothetical protein